MSKRKGTQSAETPHKRIRVSSLSEEDNDDDEEIVCPSQPNAVQCPSSSSSAESGIVESISLRNFMCHSLLGPFNFGPNVNFVVGNNGSGKSAVLTALIVALGGKAQTTNRGSALKGFVKEGENSADVSVTLKNRGRDAYRAEVYGQAITIDVRISGEGLRTYKLKSKSGQLVSSKKEELLAVMDHFNIQVDNPVSILTQEMSKHFLHSKGEGDKYKFFMKATQLEQMKEDYAYIMKTKTVIQNTVDTHEEKLQELKRKYQEKEERFKSLASLDDMQQKLDELKDQMAWALVTEMEREVNPMRERIANEERATVKYEQKVEQWKGKVVEAERKYKEVHDQLQSVTDRLQELQPERAQLKKQVQERNATFKRAENAFHRVKTNLKDLGKDKEQLTKRISELRYNISQLSAVDSQARAERMERLQAQLDTLNSQDATLAQQIDQFQQASTSAKDQHTRISCEMKDQQRSVDSKRRELAALEGSRGDRLRRFGEQMPALLAAVEEAHRHGQFKRKPIGPLGYCIRLRDAGLALAVESCLKSLMLAFCCDNYRDERQLQAIMARHCPQGRRPQIIVSEFTTTLYDTSRGAVKHPDYPTVLQSLEIDDPVVTNCLIDMRGIETILLIKNKKEARRVMQAGPPPQNCREAFTADGDQVYTNRYYSSDHHRALYLSRDVEEEIRHMQGVVQSQEKKMQSLKQQMQQQAFDQQQNEIHLQRVHDDRKRAKEHIRRLQLEINELQNVEEPQSEDLRPLEEELEELGGRLCKAQEEGEAARMKMEEMREAWGEADRQYRQNVDTMNRVAEEAEPVKEELSRSDEEVERSKHHKKHYEEKLKAHISNIDSLRDSLAQKEQELKDSVAKASEICPGRVDVRRTAKSLDSEISRLKQKITAQQDQQGDRETIIRQYQEAMGSYKNIAHQVKNLKCFIQLLSKTMNTRHKVFMEFRMWLSVRCKYYFDSMLSQRGYTGKMTFDHKNETLSISVQPGEGDKASLSDMRSLSGGERSFSTVCFVLSLWAITEAPFRCLDEFDVYMDMVNRKISLDMMQKIASSQRYRQFIFLTPQSMSSVKVSNLTRVLRLKDPDRSQTTLPFGQRNQDGQD